ncbi:NERD domain-containing protein [Bacillus timonensis]|uniref:NERD domain-containing protein n=1 Tax=Bacillus timonensis TaxID=1033734 RepID=A0A4S3PZ81_9BACI|nr:nuclease-related domain-containing protein [Bacillus timonensis]THE14984.1 NERD domain-containing protein [Bacillus timonensis]
MIFKPRGENIKLEFLQSLRVHKKLEEKDENNYIYLEKGWLGEKQFDQLLLGLTNECLILNNLLLEVNNTKFQIDSLLITQKKIYIFEVKNYEGDYYIEGDRLHMISGKEIKNPLIQLTRSESLFRQLLQKLRFNFAVESRVVFINSEFYLYNAPMNGPFVFPTQLGRYLKSLNTVAATGVSSGHVKLAEKLVSLHIKEDPYSQMPIYTYEELEKGIVCERGCSFMEIANQNYLVCPNCGKLELKESAVLRSVRKLSLLFPDKKITTNLVMEWCGVISSRLTLRKYLLKKYKLVTIGKSSYFVKKDDD